MGKGSGRGGDGGGGRGEVREFAASFEDVSLALKNERAAAAAKVAGETEMRVELVPEAEMAELTKQIYAAAKPFRGKATHARSLMYVLRDIFYIFCTYRTTLLLRPIVPMVLLFPVYSIVMGTVMLGPWVLGHECGHGAFAPHKPCVKIAGKTLDMNDAVGFVLHSALLVPFWSWQYSHNKHHKYTNHLVLGETHVPNLEGDPVIGDTFPLLRIIGMHMGFPAYLLGFSRAKTQADLKTPMDRSKWGDHFHSGSQTMPDDWRIEMSTVGCIIHLLILATNEAPDEAGWKFWYFGPYLIVNAWLVLYTWLHHTHPDVPHYGSDTFSFVRGALATIDRPYPWIIDHLHHHIGSTHVAHHLCSDVPHYRAVELREVLRPILGPYYLFDPQPMYSAVWQVATECHHVEGNAGVQYYRHKEHRSEAFLAKEASKQDSAKTK